MFSFFSLRFYHRDNDSLAKLWTAEFEYFKDTEVVGHFDVNCKWTMAVLWLIYVSIMYIVFQNFITLTLLLYTRII